MIRVKKLRQMLQAHVGQHGEIAGRELFIEGVHDLLGLGRNEWDQPVLNENRATTAEFSLRYLAEAIGGHEWVESYFDPAEGPSIRQLLEAGPGVDPTSFLNINTFNLTVAGLVEAKIMEHFMNPAFIADQLTENVPSKKNGEKFIGTALIGDKAMTRRPGESHPRVGMGEQWVTTPETVEKALAVEVQQEAVFFDLTGQVLETAGSIGDELGYRKEKDVIAGAVGATNTYNFKGNTYNTYQAVGDAGPWVNKLAANEFTDWTNIDAARQLFVGMTDPNTGKEILVNPTLALIAPAKEALFSHTLNQTSFQERTDRGADVGVRVTTGTNPLKRVMPNLNYVQSPIAFNVLQAAAPAGLGLTSTNAIKRWWLGDFKRAFKWIENWPLRVRQASPSEHAMLDRGIIAAYFANYRGTFAVREPRYVVECTE